MLASKLALDIAWLIENTLLAITSGRRNVARY
jgi:hypothetical protein